MTEKTLRELCEAEIQARAAWHADDGNADLLDASLEASAAVHAVAGPGRRHLLLAALDAERAAVLEEVRAWLTERAHGTEQTYRCERSVDAMIRDNAANEVLGGFIRRFLAGKDGDSNDAEEGRNG